MAALRSFDHGGLVLVALASDSCPVRLSGVADSKEARRRTGNMGSEWGRYLGNRDAAACLIIRRY